MLLTVSRKSHHPVETLLALKALKHLLITTHAQKFDHLVVTCSISFFMMRSQSLHLRSFRFIGYSRSVIVIGNSSGTFHQSDT